MARIRYLKPDFFKDDDLASLPYEARLFFAGLWNFADKAGRLEDRPIRLKAEIFPYDKIDVNKCLELLSKPKNDSGRPFIQRYIINNEHYIQIVNWEKHQKPHHTEQESIIPPAPPLYITEKGMGSMYEGSRELRNGEGTVKQPLSPTKKLKFLDFVLLTQEEHSRLVERLGNKQTEVYIDRVNDYVGSKGAHYKSHYHTILNWWKRDGGRRPVEAKPVEYPVDPQEQEKVRKMIHATANKMGSNPPVREK